MTLYTIKNTATSNNNNNYNKTITSTQPPLTDGVLGQPKGGVAAHHNIPQAITIAIKQ